MTRVSRDDSRLRVLTLARDAGQESGGAEVLAYEFVRRLDRERFKPYLCTTRRPEPRRRPGVANEKADLEAAGIVVLALNRDSMASLVPWSRLYSLMVREQIDILHAHMPRASIPGVVLGRLARVPVIISHEHGSTLENKRVRKFLDRNVVGRGSDVVLAVSEWDRRQMIETVHVRPDRVRVVHNGIKARVPMGNDVRSELGIPPGRSVIGVVARLTSQKRQGDALRAVALLKAEGRPVTCLLLGDGPDMQALATLAVQLGIGDEVCLTGNRSDVPDVLAMLDVAVLSSIWEGAPLAVLEYMAAGAPIVATAVGGVPELIEDGVHGLLVKPRDPAGLAAGIARLLDDSQLARRLGAAARERQRAEFDLDVTIGQLERLYLELYNRSRRAGSRQTRPLAAGH